MGELTLFFSGMTSVLRSGPVRSFSFLGKDRDRDRLMDFENPLKPDRDCYQPVHVGPVALKDRSRLVSVGSS